MSTHWSLNHPVEPEPPGIDPEQAMRMLSFLARAPLRHPWLATVTLVFGVAVGVACAALAPQIYASEVSVIVQRGSPMYDVTGAERPERGAENEPIRGVAEQLLRRDNLVALARDARIAEWIVKPKKGIAGFKQRMLRSLFAEGDPTRDKLEEVVVHLVEKSLSTSSTPTSFTLRAEWWDPEVAYTLATLAQKRFLDDRRAAEVSALSDGIAALEEHAKIERRALDEALRSFDDARANFVDEAARDASAARATTIPTVSDGLKLADPELVRALEDKRRQVRDLEDDRARRLAELRAQRAGLLATYTAAHPAVQAIESKIGAVAAEPEAEKHLKAEERQLLEQVTASAERVASRAGRVGGTVTRADGTKVPDAFTAPHASMALATLQTRLQKYEDAMDRISAAHLRLDIAEKVFRYRYSVFKPAELPNKPVRSKRLAMIATGIILGLAMSLFLSVAKDLLSGRIFESWQVPSKLGLRLLGEAHEP